MGVHPTIRIWYTPSRAVDSIISDKRRPSTHQKISQRPLRKIGWVGINVTASPSHEQADDQSHGLVSKQSYRQVSNHTYYVWISKAWTEILQPHETPRDRDRSNNRLDTTAKPQCRNSRLTSCMLTNNLSMSLPQPSWSQNTTGIHSAA